MAPNRHSYPPRLDSDDEGSVDYDADWPDDSDGEQEPPRVPAYSSVPRARNHRSSHLCVVCNSRPQYSQNGRSYPTCGLTCASRLAQGVPGGRSGTIPGQKSVNGNKANRHYGQGTSQYHATSYRSSAHRQRTTQNDRLPCVVCKVRSARRNYLTCGLTCIEKLCKDGPSDTTMCNYCHRRPKISGKDQCGMTCGDKAKVACLLCKARPKFKRFHLCGKTCKRISTKATPLILEIPKGHVTYEMVEKKFKSSWMGGTAPAITKIFKVIENEEFLKPYDHYRKRVGPQESYRYHGTKRQCQLGISTTTLCTAPSCAICSILRTSFKIEVAGNGRFGRGIYTSSASNKAFGFCSASGVMILTKVVIGKVSSQAGGPDTYIWDLNGAGNETVFYTNDAVRPVFLILFQ